MCSVSLNEQPGKIGYIGNSLIKSQNKQESKH